LRSNQHKEFELLLFRRKIQMEISFMQVTTFQGVIENGQVKFETEVRCLKKQKFMLSCRNLSKPQTAKSLI
jgi:hypothetical protein